MRVGIVGAGFAGLAAAIALREAGHDVTVFEKASGLPTAGGAISLAPNALACLSILGVRDQVPTDYWAGIAGTVRTARGEVLVRSTLAGLTGGEFATVLRSQLIGWLTTRLPAGCVRYSEAVYRVDVDGTIHSSGSDERFDLVVGADGARGVVRRSLWPKAPALRATGVSGWAWIVDRKLSSGFGTIWGRTDHFGILPLSDDSTYVYGASWVRGARLSAFDHWPDPLPELIDAAAPERMITPEIFEARPPWRLVRGRVVLIGDAAHTMQPTFGQGAALAMEDAITLAHHGAAGLSRRRPRLLALYGLSKGGAYFAAPRLAALEDARNLAMRITPDALFGSLAGVVSRWQAPT